MDVFTSKDEIIYYTNSSKHESPIDLLARSMWPRFECALAKGFLLRFN